MKRAPWCVINGTRNTKHGANDGRCRYGCPSLRPIPCDRHGQISRHRSRRRLAGRGFLAGRAQSRRIRRHRYPWPGRSPCLPVGARRRGGTAELRDAAHLWGTFTADAEDAIRDELGDRRIQVLQCGPAAELWGRLSSLPVRGPLRRAHQQRQPGQWAHLCGHRDGLQEPQGGRRAWACPARPGRPGSGKGAGAVGRGPL